MGTGGPWKTSRTLLAGWLAFALPLVAACSASSPPSLEPGAFQPPLVRLQQLVGVNDHLHTDEVRYRESDGKLFQCSYTFGVVDAREPGRMVYLAENLRHSIPGDSRRPGCIHLAWDGNVVYTVHRGNIDNPAFLSGWELETDPSDPGKLKPVQLPVLQEAGVSYEGIDAEGGLIFVAERQKGLAIYRREARRFVRIGTFDDLSNAWGVRVRDGTAYVSDGLAGLAIVDVTNPRQPSLLGRAVFGGQARGLALAGGLAYVAAGSAGLVVVDVSDPANPRAVGRATMPGSAIRVDYSDGRAYVAAWNDARVYDVTAPSSPRLIGAVRLTRDIGGQGQRATGAGARGARGGAVSTALNAPDEHGLLEDGRPPVTSRTLGVAAHGDVMFVGNWHVIYSYRVFPDRMAPGLLLPEEINLVDFGPVAAGASATVPVKVANQGTAPLTVFDVSTSNPSYTVTPSQLRLEPGGAATLSVTYRASGTDQQTGILFVRSDDPDNAVRAGYFVANQPGLGLGKALPETTVDLVDGGQWSLSEAKGKVTLLAYFATF
ncbi:MAG: DUF1573 domain-containing protein [Vicinamibacterales bacterium]